LSVGSFFTGDANKNGVSCNSLYYPVAITPDLSGSGVYIADAFNVRFSFFFFFLFPLYFRPASCILQEAVYVPLVSMAKVYCIVNISHLPDFGGS
jgi:hypothetical protein